MLSNLFETTKTTQITLADDRDYHRLAFNCFNMAKKKIDKSQRIGVTESGEIAFNLDAFDRLYEGNIIITKRLSNPLIDKLIEYKDKIILHLTCTGFGGTRIEPLVPKAEDTLGKLKKLIEGGFPTTHIVLRVDPIVPTERGTFKIDAKKFQMHRKRYDKAINKLSHLLNEKSY